jgi:hypothetical protein
MHVRQTPGAEHCESFVQGNFVSMIDDMVRGNADQLSTTAQLLCCGVLQWGLAISHALLLSKQCSTPAATQLRHVPELLHFPWDGLKLSHARMRPGLNPGLPRATSRLLARASGRVAYWVSGGFPFTSCICIPPRGARRKL